MKRILFAASLLLVSFAVVGCRSERPTPTEQRHEAMGQAIISVLENDAVMKLTDGRRMVVLEAEAADKSRFSLVAIQKDDVVNFYYWRGMNQNTPENISREEAVTYAASQPWSPFVAGP